MILRCCIICDKKRNKYRISKGNHIFFFIYSEGQVYSEESVHDKTLILGKAANILYNFLEKWKLLLIFAMDKRNSYDFKKDNPTYRALL